MRSNFIMEPPLASLPPLSDEAKVYLLMVQMMNAEHTHVDPFPVPRAFQGFREGRKGLGDFPKETAYPSNISEVLRYCLARI
ncbi:MAG: hypothetical protein A3G09_03640 [Candidatus Moranbacteria bacterium RIFCSPLOWO2_12_FULL_48_12]|nr:MAG: hypothetical protein A3G09_03640 [Candidatus Moranbacteria bacterium RIFCSPLOWO2_12_FULL_48_12]